MFNKIIEKLYLKQEDNLAFYDTLTKTYNKNWFNLYAKEEYNKEYIYFGILDLNHFKEINDSFGHQEGDLAIYNFAQEIKKTGCEVCRYGGDEFIIISYFNPRDKIEQIKYDRLFDFEFGLVYKNKNMTLEDALNEADKILYSKKEGNYSEIL